MGPNSLAALATLRLCIAMSEKSAFLAKLFRRARGTAIRQNHAWSRGFFLAQRAPRAQRNNRKKERYVQSLFHLCDLSASARNSFLPGGFWARLAALCSLVFFAFSCGKSLVAQTSRPNSRKSLISMIIPDNSGFSRNGNKCHHGRVSRKQSQAVAS